MSAERYVPVSKLRDWARNWKIPTSARAALRRLIVASLTPEAMTHEQMLETLRRCLESAESEHAAEKASHDSDRDQREET